jgi:hypothetical protein
LSPKKELILFVREHSLVNNSGKVGIADEGPMAGYSDCPRKKYFILFVREQSLESKSGRGHSR